MCNINVTLIFSEKKINRCEATQFTHENNVFTQY